MKHYSILFFIISICICFFFFSKCCNETIVEYSLDSFLGNIKIDSTDTIQVNVCDIIEARWDSLLVIKPYTPVSEQAVLRDLENYSRIKSEIKDIRSTDFYSYLVFVRNNKAIGFSRIRRGPVDFAYLPVTDNRSPCVAVLNKTNCAKVFMKKNRVLFITK
jgi:hypothetical protein